MEWFLVSAVGSFIPSCLKEREEWRVGGVVGCGGSSVSDYRDRTTQEGNTETRKHSRKKTLFIPNINTITLTAVNKETDTDSKQCLGVLSLGYTWSIWFSLVSGTVGRVEFTLA
ncbi:hypothetical protein Pcinc_043160 [Petrolisthes cinctipes]|uniref:Uncharacterized protein n=1 Tax=Petrolisthes cinctipes TaxID=88211 RepID=A0AAE1BGC5_PETCI|nr:hypothetical protein Pcinc_043160 [Petrolisthes cinctipes]